MKIGIFEIYTWNPRFKKILSTDYWSSTPNKTSVVSARLDFRPWSDFHIIATDYKARFWRNCKRTFDSWPKLFTDTLYDKILALETNFWTHCKTSPDHDSSRITRNHRIRKVQLQRKPDSNNWRRDSRIKLKTWVHFQFCTFYVPVCSNKCWKTQQLFEIYPFSHYVIALVIYDQSLHLFVWIILM